MNEELAMRSLAYLMRDYKEQDEVILNDDDIEAIKYLQKRNEQLQNNWNELKSRLQERIKFFEECDKELILSSYKKEIQTLKVVLDDMQELEQGKDE